MNKDEAAKILRHISLSLPNFDYRQEGVLETWYGILKDYSFSDVFTKVNELLEQDKFQYQAPTPQYIVRDLRKVSEKVKLNTYKVRCRNCGKLCNSYEQEERHFSKCCSVEYVIQETKKWFDRDLDREDLFNMSDEEFEARYEKLLKYIMEHTTDDVERERIGCIFNPPSQEKALGILNKKINN